MPAARGIIALAIFELLQTWYQYDFTMSVCQKYSNKCLLLDLSWLLWIPRFHSLLPRGAEDNQSWVRCWTGQTFAARGACSTLSIAFFINGLIQILLALPRKGGVTIAGWCCRNVFTPANRRGICEWSFIYGGFDIPIVCKLGSQTSPSYRASKSDSWCSKYSTQC